MEIIFIGMAIAFLGYQVLMLLIALLSTRWGRWLVAIAILLIYILAKK